VLGAGDFLCRTGTTILWNIVAGNDKLKIKGENYGKT
jgi:hypothetical protein